MSKTTILICVATLLIVAGLALGTRSGTPTPADRSSSATAESTARTSTELWPDTELNTGREQRTQTPQAPDADSNANGVATAPEPLETGTPGTNGETLEAYRAMPWMERDEREVTEEIASNAERATGPPVLPSTSFAEMQELYELVPELAEDIDAADAPVDLAELVDEPGFDLPSPGTAPRPGAYFEPLEDEED